MSAISEATNNAQLEKREQQKVLLRMARALINTYAIHQGLSLALVLRVSPSLSNEEAVACWMKQSLQHIDMELADSVFGTICNRFERCLSQLPPHLHGGVQ